MRNILFLVVFSITSTSLSAQTTVTNSVYYPKEKFFMRVKNDARLTGKTIWETYKRPLSWKKKEWLITGGVLALTGLSTLLDEPIHDYYEENRDTNPFLSDVADIGDFMGQPEHNYPFMISMWSLGVIVDSEWMRDTGILLFASITTSGLVQTALKDIVGRARPTAGEGPFVFKPFNGAAYHSFPSGHTMLALATAYVLAHQINFMPLRIAVFSIPVITGWSRIHDGAHYFSDIILGSAIGIAFAEAVINLYPKFKAQIRGKGNDLAIMPSHNGIRIVYSF